jgi:hypothetical protein
MEKHKDMTIADVAAMLPRSMARKEDVHTITEQGQDRRR